MAQMSRFRLGERRRAAGQMQAQDGSIIRAIGLVWRDSWLKFSFFTSFSLFLLLVIIIFVSLSKLPPFLPFFYSLPWGNRQLIMLPFFILTPLSIIVLFIIHCFIALKFYSTNTALIRLLFASTTIYSLLITVTMVKIILLVVG